MNNYFVILAAGKSKRFHRNLAKQFFNYKNKDIIDHSVEKSLNSKLFKKIVIVTNNLNYFKKKNYARSIIILKGGKERSDSSLIALKYLKKYRPKIVFIHDAVTQTVKGMPIKAVAPCEGTGYEIGSMSIIKGARNLDSAKKWVDFALTADVQSLAVKARAYQVPSNKGATVPPEAPDVSSIKLIDYDHGKYGSKAERTRLLAKWDREVKVLPR